MSDAESKVSPNSKGLQGSKKRRARVTRSKDQRVGHHCMARRTVEKATTIQPKDVAPMSSDPRCPSSWNHPGCKIDPLCDRYEIKVRSLTKGKIPCFFRLDAAIAHEHNASHPQMARKTGRNAAQAL